MGSRGTVAVVVLAMVVLIVGVDLMLFRDQPWPRLAANVGIVLMVGAGYWRFRPT